MHTCMHWTMLLSPSQMLHTVTVLGQWLIRRWMQIDLPSDYCFILNAAAVSHYSAILTNYSDRCTQPPGPATPRLQLPTAVLCCCLYTGFCMAHPSHTVQLSGNYKVEVFNMEQNVYAAAPAGLGFMVLVEDPDGKVMMSRVSITFRIDPDWGDGTPTIFMIFFLFFL